MAKQTKTQDKAVSKVFFILASLGAVAFLVLGGLAWWGASFANNMVKTELAAQKIYFPPAGSPALNPEKYPDLQKFAGELVDTPEEAKAYANGYIARHIADSSDGKTYAEVSTLSRQNPDDAELEELRMSVFMGETLRGILLGTGYAFGTIGKIAAYASMTLFVLSATCAVVAVYLVRKLR